MKIQPLFDPRHQQNFEIGEPHWYAPQGQTCCAVPGFDYSGRDPRGKYPKGYHVRLGDGTKASRGVHQDPDHFEPERIKVIELPTQYGVSINVIRLEGDSLGRTGGAMLLRPFEPVLWREQTIVRANLIFSPRSELATERRYANFGLRGELSFSPVKEDVEIFEVVLLEASVKLLWWHDGIEGGGNRYRKGQELQFPFVNDEWYSLTLRMTPVPEEPNTWDTRVKLFAISNRQRRLDFYVPAAERMNQGVSISHLAFGDEHQNLTDGGVFYVSRLAAERLRLD